MAIVESFFGKYRGRVGNVVFSVDKEGRVICRARKGKEGPGKEGQKRRNAVFGTLAGHCVWMGEVIRLGFPGGNGRPGSHGGFMRANMKGVVTTEQAVPGRSLSRRRGAMEEFRGVVDYGRLRLSAGVLSVPRGSVEVDREAGVVLFRSEGQPVEAVDCYTDDRVYGVVLCPSVYHCRVVEVGCRGTGGEMEVRLLERERSLPLFCYLFATRLDGLEVSDSVCLFDGTSSDLGD